MRAIVILVVAAACALGAPIAEAAFPGANGKLAFAFDDPIDGETVNVDLVNADGSGRHQLAYFADNPSWSPSGEWVAYDDRCCAIYAQRADGSGLHMIVGDGPNSTLEPAWSPDGTRLVYWSEGGLHVINSDGTGDTAVPVSGRHPVWSPDGTRIAYATGGDIWSANPDGTDPTPLTDDLATDEDPDWSPDGSRILFSSRRDDAQGELYVMNADGTSETRLTNNSLVDVTPAWSPDGGKIGFSRRTPSSQGLRLWVMAADGTGATQITSPVGLSSTDDVRADWQPLPVNAYPRPRGATPMYVSLVPAYSPCTAPNRTHGAPLAFGSCTPPSKLSSSLTVGTPDANGKGARSIGFAFVSAKVGDPSTAADEADVRLRINITDVRNSTDLTDYAGALETRPTLRITDRDNTPHPGGPGAATVTDMPFPFAVPCSVTLDAAVGSTCAVSTTADAVVAGAVKESRRTIWAIERFEVRNAAGNAFLTQGLFIP